MTDSGQLVNSKLAGTHFQRALDLALAGTHFQRALDLAGNAIAGNAVADKALAGQILPLKMSQIEPETSNSIRKKSLSLG